MKRIFPILLVTCVLVTSCYEDEQLVDYDYINGQTKQFMAQCQIVISKKII